MYIAIDGGGTKTEYLLLDKHFQVVDHYLGGCLNHDLLGNGWADVSLALKASIDVLLERNGLTVSDIEAVAAGISGLDTAGDQQQADACFSSAGISRFLAINDGYLPIAAENPAAWGVSLNCGTGMCCAAIDSSGNRIKLAGMDEWSGDAGGGNWIVMQMYRKVYENLILKDVNTPLVMEYVKAMNLGSKVDFINSWSDLKEGENAECKALHRKIIWLFFELLERSNPEAQALADQMIKCAAYSIDAAVRELHFSGEKIPVYLSGSILTKAASSGYLSMLKEALSCICQGKLEVHMCTKRPVEGAVQLMKFPVVENFNLSYNSI